MTSPMTAELTAPVALTWKKSKYLGYTAQRGDLMSWHRGDVFPEATAAWVSFRAERDAKGWTLRAWTHSATKPSLVMQFDRLAECKEAAMLLAASVANWYDDRVVGERDHWMVDSWLKGASHGVSMFVSYPEQRDGHDVKRLAEYGVAVTL